MILLNHYNFNYTNFIWFLITVTTSREESERKAALSNVFWRVWQVRVTFNHSISKKIMILFIVIVLIFFFFFFFFFFLLIKILTFHSNASERWMIWRRLKYICIRIFLWFYSYHFFSLNIIFMIFINFYPIFLSFIFYFLFFIISINRSILTH